MNYNVKNCFGTSVEPAQIIFAHYPDQRAKTLLDESINTGKNPS